MTNDGVDDAMFCEVCSAHRDQLGTAGRTIMRCPDCGRATCANCWNQLAGGCLSCRAFTLQNVAPPLAMPGAMPTRSAMPGVVAGAGTAGPAPTRRRTDRFGQVRLARVVRATVLRSAHAISIAVVGYAGAHVRAPGHVADTPATSSPSAPAGATAMPASSATMRPPETP